MIAFFFTCDYFFEKKNENSRKFVLSPFFSILYLKN